MSQANYLQNGLAQAQSAQAGYSIVPTLRESLTMELNKAEAEVSRLQELIALLDEHPEVNRIMELLGRRGY